MLRPSAIIRLVSVLIAAGALVIVLRWAAVPDVVRSVFATYKRAVLEKDGTTAASLLDSDTIGWYRRIQQLALHGSRDEVEALQPLDKMQVLAFRQRVPAGELRDMPPRQLVAYSITHGWVGKSALARAEVSTVKVSGGVATAEVQLGGRPAGQYRFVNEDGAWRLDQLPFLEEGNATMRTAAQQRKYTEDQLVLTLLERALNNKVKDDIWDPPFPQPKSGATEGTGHEPKSGKPDQHQ